jgi:hypothetical protein
MSLKPLDIVTGGGKTLSKAKGAARNLTSQFLKAKQRGSNGTSCGLDSNLYENETKSR